MNKDGIGNYDIALKIKRYKQRRKQAANFK
jgi:hypothetical protein